MSDREMNFDALDAIEEHEEAHLSAVLRRIRAQCEDDAGCWRWTGFTDAGNPKFHYNGSPTNVRRAAYIEVYGDVPEGYLVVGTCDTPLCVHPACVEAMPLQKRKKQQGRRSYGRPSAKRTASIRALGKLSMEIARIMRASDETQKVLGERYGVSAATVGCIRRNEIWREMSPFAGLGAR